MTGHSPRMKTMRTPLLLILLALPAPRLAADELGRLFFTPQERAMLDAQRHREGGLAVGGDTLTINGLVTRSSGKNTVWLNGVPSQGNPSTADIAITGHQGSAVRVQLPRSGQHVDVQVGQTLDTASGKVREIYERPPKSTE